MSYAAVIEGLKVRFATIPSIKLILDYEPTSIHDAPLLYMLFDNAPRTQTGQVTVMPYRVLCRLAIRWVDNELAERELIPFVNSLPAAIDADATLGGKIASGMARVTNVQGVFVTIGGVLYRALDVTVEATDKGPWKGGL